MKPRGGGHVNFLMKISMKEHIVDIEMNEVLTSRSISG